MIALFFMELFKKISATGKNIKVLHLSFFQKFGILIPLNAILS